MQAAGYGLLLSVWLGTLGPIAPLLLMASLAALAALAPVRTLSGLLRCWPLMIVGGLACLSALWSTAPGVSLRYGLQLAITLAAAITLASVLSPEKILRSLFLSSLTVLGLCILSGRQGQSVGGPVLIGILGSKNEIGGLCQLVICSGLVVTASSSERPWLRVLALPILAVSGYVLVGSFATGAVLGTGIFLALAAGFVAASRIPPASKFVLALTLLSLMIPLWIVREDLGDLWTYFVTDVLGKDVGLTGRDYLWAHADRLIADRPVLGHGYRSTWLGDSAETIGLLRWAGLSSGAGFNFHDTYREWAVDFGFAGAVVVGLCLLAGLMKIVVRNLSTAITPAGVFFAAMGVTMMIRAKLETVLGPFGSSAVLLSVIVSLGYLQPALKQAGAKRSALPVGRRLPPPRFGRLLPPSRRPDLKAAD